MSHSQKITGKIREFWEFIKTPHRRINLLIRGVLILAVLVLGFLEFEVCFGQTFLWSDAVTWLKSLKVDVGGFASLLATVAMLLIFGVDRSIKSKLDKVDGGLWQIIILALAIAGLLGIWLAIRVFGLYIKNYLEFVSNPEDQYRYITNDIFTFISFVLGANLCFSLVRTFTVVGAKPIDKERDNAKIGRQERDLAPELIDILLQVAIIGVIAYMPRYGDDNLLKLIGGSNGYVFILLSLVVTIAVLVFARQRVRRLSDEMQKSHLYF